MTGAKIPYRGRMVKLFVNYGTHKEINISYKNGFYIGCHQDLIKEEGRMEDYFF